MATLILKEVELLKGPPAVDYVHQMKMAQLQFFAEKDEERRNDGTIHASDTIGCLRLSCFRKLDPNPSLTDEQIHYYSRGIAMHEYFQRMMMYYRPDELEKEVRFTHNGMPCTADMVDWRNNRILEIKTTNTQEIQKPYQDHIDQIKIYMAVSGILEGTILYFKMLNPGKPFAQFDVRLKEEYRNGIIDKLIADGNEIDDGIRFNDPKRVTSIYRNPYKQWKCIKNGVPNCKYYEKCREIEGFSL